MKVVFAGTPAFAVATLAAIVEAGHEVVGVYTQPDRPAGRGRKLQPSPVKQFALEHDLPVFQPETLKDAAAVEQLRGTAPEVMVVVAYGLILPEDVLAVPEHGCLNVHASLLPRWRGAAPIQRAIEAGDAETGVTIMQMDVGLDTGAMLHKAVTPIAGDDTAETLHDRLAGMGAQALVKTLTTIKAGTLAPEPQDEALATYAAKLNKAEAEVDWQQPAEVLARRCRAFNPWPVLGTRWQGKRLRIWQAQVSNHSASGTEPGTVLATGDDGIEVATGDGVLRLIEVQIEGGKRQLARDFVNGHRLGAGDRLGA